MTTSPPATRPTGEQAAREQDVVERAVASFEDCPDPRLRQVLQSLTRHLHEFVREVRLSEREWGDAIAFLTAAGHITNESRQEFILLSDVLGLSTQTVAVNNEAHRNATESTQLGSFFVDHSPEVAPGGDITGGAQGRRCWVEGTVTDTDGAPVSGARIEVWQADADGFYDVQYPDGRVACRGHLYSGPDGRYAFWGLRPTPYPIPTDGPVGVMLEMVGRSPVRAAHLHFLITAPGHRPLVTHVLDADDPQLKVGDPFFGVKDSLVRVFEEQSAQAPTPDGRDLNGADWTRVRFDPVLAPQS